MKRDELNRLADEDLMVLVEREDGEVVIQGSLDGADAVHVTREPEGGSEEPTEPILMSAPLS